MIPNEVREGRLDPLLLMLAAKEPPPLGTPIPKSLEDSLATFRAMPLEDDAGMRVETAADESVTSFERPPCGFDLCVSRIVARKPPPKLRRLAQLKLLGICRHDPLKVAVIVAFHQVLRNDYVAVRMVSRGAGLVELVAIDVPPLIEVGVLPGLGSGAVVHVEARIVGLVAALRLH